MTAACECCAIRAEHYNVDIILVSDEGMAKLTCVGIPEADGFIPAPCGEDTPISTESDAYNDIRMSSNSFEMFTGEGVP